MTRGGEPGRPRPRWEWTRWPTLVFAVLALAFPAGAHPAVSAVAIVKIEPGGRVTVTLSHDALAFALNDQPAKIADAPMLALLNGPRDDLAAALLDAKERLASGMRLTADGQPL